MRTASLIAAALVALTATPAPAQPKADPDWPCVQRKVARLSPGMMWAGPLPDLPPDWQADPALTQTAALIAARRTPMAEVAALADAVTATPGQSREERLALLFAAAFKRIDSERARIADGVSRYARRQQTLSDRIDAAQTALAQAEAEAAPDDFDTLDRIEAMRDTLAWDLRIYEERQRSLTYVCESPVLLEQRAFAVARALMAARDAP